MGSSYGIVLYLDADFALDNEEFPIGATLSNHSAYVVGENLQPVPWQSPGETCIGGAGVGVGYLTYQGLFV